MDLFECEIPGYNIVWIHLSDSRLGLVHGSSQVLHQFAIVTTICECAIVLNTLYRSYMLNLTLHIGVLVNKQHHVLNCCGPGTAVSWPVNSAITT